MKLKTRKLQYPKRSKPHSLSPLLLFILFFPFAGFAQHSQYTFKNTPVSVALLEVANKANIRIAFDDSKLKKFNTSEHIKSEDIKSILSSVLQGTGYYAEYKHNTWLIIKPSAQLQQNSIKEKWISGTIFDKRTGESLPYASIYIHHDDQFLPSTVDGKFSAKTKVNEKTYFQVKYLGYQTLDTIIDIQQTNATIRFPLIQKSKSIATVNVEANNLEMLNISNNAGHFTFNPHRFSDLPNYGEPDVFRALQFLPGISTQENSSQLNIRGSSADQNLVMFDGFTLYNLDHFFGVFSAINPNVIKDIQVYRGGFDSRYGERVSGIVDITGKSGNKTKPEFYGGINLISANLAAEIPLSNKITLLAAARRSYTDVYSSWLADAILSDNVNQGRRFPGANNTIEPKFYFGDFNTKLTWSPSEKDNISFSVYGGKDILNSSNLTEREQLSIITEDYNDWGNYGFGLSWKKQYGIKYFTNLQLGHSGYYNNYTNNTNFTENTLENIVPDFIENIVTNEENDLIDYFINFQNTYFLDKYHQLEFGISAKYNEFKFYKDAGKDFVYNKLENSSMLYTAFIQDQITIKNKLVIKPGFRINYYNKTQKPYFEPRLTANYKASDKLLFKMATGRYYQFLNKSQSEQNYGYSRDFWVLSDENQHPVVSSNHYIIGASYKTKKILFDVEAYYKTVEGLQEYLFFPKPRNIAASILPFQTFNSLQSSSFISGSGDAYGIDFLIKYENTNITSWLAYSISKSTRNFGEINNGENIPTSFDQTHELKWTNIYSFHKWNFSAITLYHTGKPYIESSEKNEDFISIRKYNRLPNYFRTDLSVNYNFKIKKVELNPGFSLLNAFNTENYLDVYTHRFNVNNETFQETTLVKAQDLTFNFFINFRF